MTDDAQTRTIGHQCAAAIESVVDPGSITDPHLLPPLLGHDAVRLRLPGRSSSFPTPFVWLLPLREFPAENLAIGYHTSHDSLDASNMVHLQQQVTCS